MKVIICGAGAIGAATAFFLARRGAEVVVVERHEAGGSASGKSGGFLALDWNRGTALDVLARRSFALHAELAEELGNPWQYRRLKTSMGQAAHDEALAITGTIGTPETTAVVEPRRFTQGLLDAARACGATLVHDTVAAIGPGRVELESGERLEGDAILIAMGPWSVLACRWLTLPAVYGVKGHSLIFATGEKTPSDALFLEYREQSGEVLTPEIFPRAGGPQGGTVWACAISSTPGMPVDPAQATPDDGAHRRLEALCRSVVPQLKDAPVVARQACFRPLTEDGLPLMGEVPGAPRVFIATGHSVWGMLNAPASGEAMAELMIDGVTTHVGLHRFAPSRLPAYTLR